MLEYLSGTMDASYHLLGHAGESVSSISQYIDPFWSSSTLSGGLTGAIVGCYQNSLNYVVQVGGRSSNILNIFDKNHISTLGNLKWYARIDMPHGNVPYHHINVNKAITGVKDPHIRISGATAQAAGATGRVFGYLNKIGPAANALYIAKTGYDVGKLYITGNVAGAVVLATKEVTSYYMKSCGASAGAAAGSVVFPGVGTLAGTILGGVLAGMGSDSFIDFIDKKAF
ncbi:hypothetical protein L5515_005554 [Caenorhabditis briggsae]|uniref:Uncharacterized protein n=1 Tax=Caenorhabditis briggsae TaxID=6238 RepID=A0AAE9ES29_CAEBR|nr:hypothetical protein L5515_005554 [Caenorhabditis briggsae]